jgi:hypothetical protein
LDSPARFCKGCAVRNFPLNDEEARFLGLVRQLTAGQRSALETVVEEMTGLDVDADELPPNVVPLRRVAPSP